MSALQAIKAARAAGVRLGIDGEALTLEAAAAPAPTVIAMLATYKSGVIALLRLARDGWSAADWLGYFDERVLVAEREGGLPRPEAEARAFACCIAEWLNRNPVHSPADRCLGCGGPERSQGPLLPFGSDGSGAAWLHSRSWSDWYAARRNEAITALALIGIMGWNEQRDSDTAVPEGAAGLGSSWASTYAGGEGAGFR